MDAIKAATQILENAPTTRKEKTRDVEDAISQLSSVVRLFELSSPSANTFTRLTDLLRGRVLPLYRTSLLPALEYAAAVFRFIYQNMIAQAVPTREQKATWESLAVSLLSGILDFLDESTNSRHREIVASVVFPLLCPLFFCQSLGNVEGFDGSLSSVVYQLLMTTVELHAHNAGKLRDQDIGSKQLGFTISQTKELLAMESLLELFAVLIPPVKDGREKRTQFIKEVFDSSIFSCSDRIILCLESIASPDWSITASEIMDTLAESDISFPQPFEASCLNVNEVQMHEISSFYVDKSKFIANLHKDGQIETFHLPFSTVRKISTSPSRNGEVQIIVNTSELPMFGDKPIDSVIVGEISVSWTLKQARMHKFAKVLKSRYLSVQAPSTRKLSKTEEIKLDFDSNMQDSSAHTREKVQSISQLWASGALPTSTGQIGSTSPLAPHIRTPGRISDCDENPVDEFTRPTTVFLEPGGNFSFEPHINQEGVNATVKSHKHQHLNIPTSRLLHTDKSTGPLSNDEISQPKSRVTRSNRRIIAVSDDDEEVSPSLPKHQQLREQRDDMHSRPKTNVSEQILQSPKPDHEVEDEVTRPVSTDLPKGLGPQGPLFKLKRPFTPIESSEASGVIEEPAEDTIEMQDPADDHDGLDYPPAKKSKKRPAQAIEDGQSSALLSEEKRPAKRSRLEPPHHPVAPNRPNQRKTYGRKGPNSSPKLSTTAVDFDEFPPAEAPKPIKESKPRASAMKGKNGKPVAKVKAKRASIKTSGVKHENLNLDLKYEDDKALVNPVKNDPDITLVNVSDNALKPLAKDIVVQQRRSARVANTATSNKGDSKKSGTKRPDVKKPRKAPWEDKDFLEKNKIQFDHVAEPPCPIEGPIQPLDPAPSVESEILEAETLFFDNNDGSYTETFSEYFEPTKTGTSSSDHVPVPPTSRSIIIDLTQDESPKPPLRPQKAAIGRRRSLPKNTAGLPRNKESFPAHSVSPCTRNAESSVNSSTMQEMSLPLHTDLVKVANDSFLPFREDEKILNGKQPASANSSPTFQQTKSPLPFAKVKVTTKNPLLPHREDEQISKNKIERLTSPASPNVEDEPFKGVPVSFALPRSDSSRRKNQHHARSSETTAGKQARGQENRGPNARPQQRFKKATVPLEPEEQPMDRIVDILNQINEAVIHKVERRFDGVTKELHAGQRIILEGTANVLQEMCDTSSRHFNDMVDLDREYTSHCNRITNGLHDYQKSTEQLSQCFKNIVIDHSRRSLSKKLPTTLFPKIPDIILNPTIRL